MLTIYQGNDKDFVIFRKTMGGKDIKTQPLKMWFTVKSKINEDLILFQKEIGNGITQNSDGSWNIRIDADDTKNFKITDDKLVLVCDIKIINEQGEGKTIAKPQDFVVLPVVTL